MKTLIFGTQDGVRFFKEPLREPFLESYTILSSVGALSKWIHGCRFRSYVSLFRVSCHRSVTIPDFMSPAFGRVVVGPVAWAHRQVVVCASRMGNLLRDT